MQEINELVREFDDRIVLSAEHLYERFGRENGRGVLEQYFQEVVWRPYEDSLKIDVPEPLIEYILSCHGNQNRYILDRYTKFRSFVIKKMSCGGMTITKDAGVFFSKKL